MGHLERIRNTLSHEMCHLACWAIDNQPREGHGQLFKSWLVPRHFWIRSAIEKKTITRANKVMYKHPDIHISVRNPRLVQKILVLIMLDPA